MARELGINEASLDRWVSAFKARNDTGETIVTESERAEVLRLRKENADLKLDRAFLKEGSIFFAQEASELALVKIRASQINGCAYCLDMHGREARAAGIDQRRLDVLAGWEEAPNVYSERERAALALTEAVTLIGNGGVSDSLWGQVRESFEEREIVQLLMAIAAINVWNRLAVSTHQSLPPQTT
ncbi:carboxymuconolactone decarboxylase family protein [Cryobacterium sp. Y62]|uniref:carboxymuconolactone decarboxylase family protein n=1 Tax=Cryobacterium sp. Y62 TaxID=2048284 RepID=UPI001304A936|nr:carboxymuconolactone decarboxylase family protein [Cryobacterium sp. Y62]